MRSPEEQTAMEIAALMHDQPFGFSRDITRNIQTIFRRFSHEGFSFLSKTLPSLGRSFDQALSGNVAFSLPTSFKRYKKTCFPHFLGSALRRIFDQEGMLLQCPCYETVKFLRTLFYYAYKIEVPFDESQIQEFSKKFVEVDQEIGAIAICGDGSTLSLRSLMRSQLSHISYRESLPAYGPGISSNCRREDKYNQFVPPSKLRNHFGREFFHLSEEFRYEYDIIFVVSYWHAFLQYESAFEWNYISNSKVLFVPKDSRGPRTICCEDSRMMYAQKSLQKALYGFIESSDRFGGYVNFTDQTINQRLTYDKSNATLDLKDASDRVSLNLVIDVFPPKLVDAFIACRSPIADLPDGLSYRMEKFAPMGSALCFPVMALIAFTACTSAIYLAGGPMPHRNTRVFVYGDDIIVPNEYAQCVISALQSIGLAVNVNKSFINSRFLESCGADTLDQSDVTPLRKKKFLLPKRISNYRARRVIDDTNGGYPHNVSLGNAAEKNRYQNLASSIFSNVENLYGSLPYGNSSSPYICKYVSDENIHPYNEVEGYDVNGKLRALRVKDKKVSLRRLSPYSRMRRNLIESNYDPRANDGYTFDPDNIGARSTFLQPKTFIKWGLSYS